MHGAENSKMGRFYVPHSQQTILSLRAGVRAYHPQRNTASMANLPPVLSECEPIESWVADQPRQEIVWLWNRFVAMGPRGGAWTHQQRRLLQNPAAYYANQAVRDKDDMQAPDICMRMLQTA
ncbi:unnamed protein product [Ectocarpus sp. 13 AM-2016]